MTQRKVKNRARSGRKKKKAKSVRSEVSALGQALRTLGGLGGGALGSLVGSPALGSNVGNSLAAAFSKWIGAGDYTVHANSIVQKAAASIPMMHNNGQAVVIRHREFIGTIAGTSGFSVPYTIKLNPGLITSFPWLSSIALNFQEYSFKGLVYHYIPTSGTAVSGTNSALGAVMIQTSYRSNDSAPANKVEMLNEFFANETVPSETMVHPIECDPKENPFAIQYVRGGNVPTGDNQLLYDLGTTYVATQGMQGTNIVGDLWCTYEVELRKPIVSSNVTSLVGFYSCLWGGVIATNNIFVTPGAITGNLPVSASVKTVTLPAGYSGTVLVYAFIQSASVNMSGANVTWAGAVTINNGIAAAIDGINSTITSTSTTVTTASTVSFVVGYSITDPSQPSSVVFPSANISAGTLSSVSLQVLLLGN